jgi:transcriptional regulator with XRE-family HTH domain
MAASKERSKPKFPLDQEPEAITWARKRSGLSMTQLSDLTGIRLSLLSEIESGTRNATPANLMKIAGAMNCPVVFLERKRCPESAA